MKRRDLGSGIRVPELDHPKRISRDDRPVPEHSNAPDHTPHTLPSRPASLAPGDLLLFDGHSVNNPPRLDVPLPQTAIRAPGNDPAVLPDILLCLVVVLVTLSRGLLLVGRGGRRRGTPGDGEKTGFCTFEFAMVDEVGVVGERDEAKGTIFAAEGEKRRGGVDGDGPEGSGLGGEESLHVHGNKHDINPDIREARSAKNRELARGGLKFEGSVASTYEDAAKVEVPLDEV
jgi:hypothetical protein